MTERSPTTRARAVGARCRPKRRTSTPALLLAVACAALAAGFEAPVRAAVALTAIAPLGASAGVNVQITGTGFDPVASNNTVTITPQGGAAVNLVAETIAVLDAAKGLRRIGITVPSGLAVGTANILVRNRTTNESAGGRTLEIIQITLPQASSAVRGAQQVAVRIDGSAHVQFVAGRTTPTFGAGITVNSTQVVSPTSLIATISVSSTTSLGPRTINIVTSTQTALLAGAFTVTNPNRPPVIASTAVITGAEGQPYSYQVVATDPDGDAVTYRLVSSPSGMTMAGGLITWTPSSTHVGNQSVVVEAMDGRGGTSQQSFQITVSPAVQLQTIDVQPSLLRFSVADTTRPLSVIGLRTNGTTVDLTAPSSGTTYESSNAFVARVAAGGTVTAVANGSATITARNGALSDTAAVVVEVGVALESLELTPGTSTLRSPGSTQALSLRGRFSDGSIRDLTTVTGTTYESSNPLVASVGATGTVTAVANGQITATARHDTRTATATVAVNISSGVGFLRGEAYDDSKGLPLDHVTVSLLSDGGGTLATPVNVVADERGQFSIAGRAGEAIVRIAKAGFTSVERRATIPAGSSATLFDARLTPLDPTSNLVSSAVGGQARNHSGRATLQIPPGGLSTDQSMSLTLLSAQGLGALLPAGWSPVAAVDIEPASIAFGFPLALTLPNTASLPSNITLAVARFDASSHEWTSAGTATIDAGGLTLRTTIERSGQFALLVPDAAPFTPAEPTPGAPLTGIDRPANQTTGVTAVGEVVPRSAPPGDDARALGRVGLTTPAPAPSGTFLQARVSERFDLLDQTQVVTQPFTQDLVSYATPRPAVGGALGATFPITPSRNFTIQELMLGVVRLDVTPFAGGDAASVVGPGGGTVTSTDGDTLLVPTGALPDTVPITLRRLTAADAGVTVPAGFELLAALQVDLVGVTLSAPAQLSTAAAGGLTAQDQILVARAFTDPFGQRRLELVAIGELSGGRLVTRTTLGSLSLAGVRSGGEFVYLRAQQAIGFVTGTVTRSGGAALSGVLVTSDSVGIADVTGADGRYLVAARTGLDTTLRAVDPASRDSVSAIVRLDTVGQTLTANLALSVVGPTVIAVSPAAGAIGVALDTSVTVDFSEALDPASISDTTVVLQRAGTAVAADRTLSADARRVVLRPSSPLPGLSTYTLQLTAGLHDLSGNPLTGYTPVSFTTLDPSRPAGPAPGRIVAELPDESGFVLITGAPGVAAGGAAVTVINLRTQETATVLALADGSFRLRVSAVVGDELTLTLRGADGRDTTIAITQFVGSDGSITVGAAGGTIPGPGDRTGTILPRALAAAGTFRLEAKDTTGLPPLPGGFAYADSFALSIIDATFKALASLTLTESQNRIAPASSLTPPFAAAAELTTPPDAFVNSTLRFTAVVSDADGVRRTVDGSTLVAGSAPDTGLLETSHTADFPTLFVSAPREALPAQLASVHAIAPAARVDLDAPVPAGVVATDTLLLTERVSLPSGAALALVDRLAVAGSRLRTVGRELPGVTAGGDYAVVSTHETLVFVTGIASGPQATVAVDGLPFVFRTGGPNGRFLVVVRANAAFTLRFFDANGVLRGTASGQAGVSGTVDVGDPLGATATVLTVSGDPTERSVVDINASLVLRFSEPIDAATLPAALVVTDDAGNRVFGRIVAGGDGTSVAFTPFRRWRYGTRYRYGVATSALARSGARLRTPFNSQFTTFQPSVLGSLALSDARDVALAGATAVIATGTGIVTVDVASPRAPRVIGQATIGGGANGVTVLNGASIIDRNGQSHAGPIALVASGGVSSAGSLRSFDLSTPASPAALGSTQLTNASGQAAPAGVPAFVGTPLSVAAGADGLAFVAIEGVGASSVQVGQAIPLDATLPARGAGPRYPSPGAESANDVVRLGTRLLVAGVAGLTVLDAVTMQRLGGVSTTGNAQGVAALPAFRMDVNGDGVIVPGTEVFDLAVVANGLDGTLQMYRVPEAGDPVLLSAVRFNGETTDVQVDATERLAYVGVGSRGLAIVDLDGPASVQPIDADRNGVDDRALGRVETGHATRVSLDLARGLGYSAAGFEGFLALQLLPPRTKFLSLTRDPVPGLRGDEEPILATKRAFTTDNGLELVLDAQAPPETDLLLVIDEGAGRVTFGDASNLAHVVPGLNRFPIAIVDGAVPGMVTFSIRQNDQPVASLNLALGLPPTGAELQSLFLWPDKAVLSDTVPTLQLAAGGRFSNGLVLNLTTSASGSGYVSADLAVAGVDSRGVLTAFGGGRTEVAVRNGARIAAAAVEVRRAATLVALEVPSPVLTLTRTQTPVELDAVGRFSDRTTRPAREIAGTTFSTSSESVVGVSSAGALTARADGDATVAVVNGSLRAQVDVAVELSTRPHITGITVDPIAAITLDSATADVGARVQGTGTLAGVTITFSASVAGVSSGQGVTSFSGASGVRLRGFTTAGQITITASVVDPTTGATLTSTGVLAIAPASRDVDGNDGVGTPSPLRPGNTIQGSIGNADTRDFYRVETDADGILRIVVTLPPGTSPGFIVAVVRNADGSEVSRVPLAAGTNEITAILPAGAGFISLETAGPASTYTLSFSAEQAPLTVASAAPSSGGPGTLVTITGTGFSREPGATIVLFGGVAGKVLGTTPTQIQVQVPAHGTNGPLRIVSGARSLVGPLFVTGASARARGFLARSSPALIRRDPVTGATFDVTRLAVEADALASLTQIEEVAAARGGSVAGFFPVINLYVLTFPANRSLAGLEALRQQVLTHPLIVGAERIEQMALASHGIDTRDRGGFWPGSSTRRGTAFEHIFLYEAIEAIQTARAFRSAADLQPIRVAVIDSGFAPTRLDEFTVNGEIVNHLRAEPVVSGLPIFTERRPLNDRDGHGTAVAGLIGAVNNGSEFSGVLNSLFPQGAQPYGLLVYNCASSVPKQIDNDCALGALQDLVERGDGETPPTPTIVNISWGLSYANKRHAFDKWSQWWHNFVSSMATYGTTVIAAAGNDGVDAAFHLPGAAVGSAPNGLAVAATSLYYDSRADYTGADLRVVRGDVPCGPTFTAGSNCGSSVTLAAPGEAVFTTATSPAGYDMESGTSLSAPLVTGVVALMQASRPTRDPLDSTDIKRTLVRTADDISDVWLPGAMRRLNALSAIRATLPSANRQRIFVSDGGQTVPNLGHVVGIDISPTTGQPTPGVPDALIPLSVPTPLYPFSRPTTSVTSTATGVLYVLVRGVESVGDGVMVINTEREKAERFIALSGDNFATTASSPTPVFLSNHHVGLVLSKDERLLFVAGENRLFVINLSTESVVRMWEDLPDPYRPPPSLQPPDSLDSRLQQISNAIGTRRLIDLALASDGRTLFGLLSSGGGIGEQPGAVLPIDVDMSRDADPTPGLQPDLIGFLSTGTQRTPEDPEGSAGDEPSAVAVNPAGGQLYVAHGGAGAFIGAPAYFESPARYAPLADPLLIGAGAAGATSTVETLDAMSRDGVTLLDAPGLIATFNPNLAAGQVGAQVGLFPSEVVYSWRPSAESGGRVVNQLNFREVYAKRPFGIAVHPKGDRAIIGFGQTGNFGVLDVSTQSHFPGAPTSSTGLFTGLAAVTQSVRLSSHLWPIRGAFTSGDDPPVQVPAIDERLLWTGPVRYAQNGQFAAGTHAGTRGAGPVEATFPDFTQNPDLRSELRAAGFVVPASGNQAIDPEGNPVTAGATYLSDRGGGAVTILPDQLLKNALENYSDPVVGYPGRPQFTAQPLCKQVVTPPARGCFEQPYTTLFTYTPVGGSATRFEHPEGIAIQPFLTLETPRHGDEIAWTTPFAIRWRDSAASRVSIAVRYVGGAAATVTTPQSFSLTPETQSRKSATVTFSRFFPATVPPASTPYDVTITLESSAGVEIASLTVRVKY